MSWQFITSWTHSTNVAGVNFTDLGSFSELRILQRNTTMSNTGFRGVQVSSNNGSSFLTASGDYVGVFPSGSHGNSTYANGIPGSATTALSGELAILNWNQPQTKEAICLTSGVQRYWYIPSPNAMNAIRVSNSDLARLYTGGSMYIFGRGPSPPWELIASTTISAPVPNVDFLNLADYDDILVIVDSVPSASSSIREVVVSTNNGSSWLTTSGDYMNLANSSGAEVAAASITGATVGNTAARSAVFEFNRWNMSQIKLAQRKTIGQASLIPVASPLNALRVSNAGFNMTGGSIHVYGRPAGTAEFTNVVIT